MTQKLHGLIEYTANKFGHVADHSVPAFLVYRSPFLTSEGPAEHIVPRVLDPHSAHVQMRSFSTNSVHEQVDSKVILQDPRVTLDARGIATTPTNHRTHHFWREMTLVTPQQG